MSLEQKMQYPKKMLPTVNYDELENSSFLSINIVDLEYGIMNHLSHFISELTLLLKKNEIVQKPELMVAHLCAYLGFIISMNFNQQKSLKLIPDINELIESQAKKSYESFSTFLENHSEKNKEDKEKQFEQLRNNTPSSIVVQTMRLGRVIWDSLDLLYENYTFYKQSTGKTQIEYLCPQDLFFKLMKQQAKKLTKDWKDQLSMLFVINQISLQIGWIMGYFGYYEKNSPNKLLEFGLPCIEVYLELGLASASSASHTSKSQSIF